MADPQIAALTVELGSLANSLRTLVSSVGKTANAIEAKAKKYEAAGDEVAKFSVDLVKGRKLTKEQQKLTEDAIKLKKKELIATENLTRQQQKASDAMKQYGASSPQAIAAQNRANVALDVLSQRQAATAEAAGRVESSFDGLVKGTKIAQAAMVWFGATVKAQVQQLIAQQKANGGVIEGTNSLADALIKQQKAAFSIGVTGEELAKVSAAARQTFNAMGGTEQSLKTLTPAIDRMRILTGSSAEGLKLAADAAREFSLKGVRPSVAGMERYTDDLVQLSRQTGMNTQQANEYYNEIANDVDSIDLLRSARAGEREAILANQRALVQQSIAMGMSAEQAKEAAKMLNKMVAAKPLDRIRQAAKIRALGGAMGIAGSNEAAEALIAGKRATPQQQQALQQFSQNAANASNQAAGKGLGSEIFAQSLLDKLDLNEQFGKGSNFSTSLSDSLKPSIDIQKDILDSSKTEGGRMFGIAEKTYNQIGMLVSGQNIYGVAIAGILAVTTSIAAMMGAGKAAGAIGDLLGGRGTRIGGGAGAGAGKLAGLGKLAGGATKLLGGIGGAAAGAYEGYEEYQQTGKAGAAIGKGTGAAVGGGLGGWGGAAAGAALGTAILPGIGTVAGGLIGGLAGGWLGGAAGGAAGKAVGSLADSKDVSQAQEAITGATQATADGIATQLKQMDTQNNILAQLKDMNAKQVDLMEKQLQAMSMTDVEKQAAAKITSLRQDNKFASQYNYL